MAGSSALGLRLKNTAVRAATMPFLNISSFNGKILVVIQLKGGNDGLNSIIPIENSIYYTERPNLAIAKSAAVTLTEQAGLHPSLAPLKAFYDDGLMNIVQNVGYEDANRSHFRSTDIWLSGSGSNEYIFDGWTGRFLAHTYPGYPAEMPEHPMAIQIGSVQSLMLESIHGNMGVAIEDPNQFYQLVSGSEADDDPPPDTIAGQELKFLKQVAAQSIQYADVIKEKSDAASNLTDYPNTTLGSQLAIIANLITGGLNTPVYLTTQSGYDTHANQLSQHETLLTQLAEAVAAFQQDLKLNGADENVLLITVSEFGRRLSENASAGTDHGTAAPLFMIGNPVMGGLFGQYPDLVDLDSRGDIKFEFDFRQVYASILKDHFGKSDAHVEEILLKTFETLPLLKPDTAVSSDSVKPLEFELRQNVPNPFNPSTTIGYSIASPGRVRITVFSSLGRKIRSLVDTYQQAGRYSIQFDGRGLPSGTYIYRIQTDQFSQFKKMTLVK